MNKEMSLLDLLIRASQRKGMTVITKQEFGRIMHDPTSTEEEIQRALDMLEDAEGYENLAD